MESRETEWVRVSARMPKDLMKGLMRLFPKENISELLRDLIQREIVRQKVMKAHLKLYGRFKPEHFDEGLL